jgi:hypothetical protein
MQGKKLCMVLDGYYSLDCCGDSLSRCALLVWGWLLAQPKIPGLAAGDDKETSCQ